jgi:hypothetical protein
MKLFILHFLLASTFLLNWTDAKAGVQIKHGNKSQLASIKKTREFKKTMLTLSVERTPTYIEVGRKGQFTVNNIIHNNALWKAHINIDQITAAWAYTLKLPLGMFHFSAGFELKEAVELRPMDKNLAGHDRTKMIVLGTGPTISMSVGAMTGQHSISSRAMSIENFSEEAENINEIQKKINSEIIDVKKLFLAFAEEANRIYFMQQLRISLLDSRKNAMVRDPLKFNNYTVFSENCITSGMRNLSFALRPKYHESVLSNKILKNDIKSFSYVVSNDKQIERIAFFEKALKELSFRLKNHLSSIDNPAIFDTPLDLKNASDLVQEAYERGKYFFEDMGKNNRMALPWRSKEFLRLVTSE